MEYSQDNRCFLLFLVYITQKSSNGSSIRDIVEYMFTGNEINYDEFKSSLDFLLSTGLLKESDKKIYTADLFNVWFEEEYKRSKGKKKSEYRAFALRIKEFLYKYVNKNTVHNKYQTRITKQDFKEAQKQIAESWAKWEKETGQFRR